MITETGIVVAIEASYIKVAIQKTSHCGQCAANKGCGSSALAKVLGQSEVIISVLNTTKAKLGDKIIIGITESTLLWMAFLVYFLPLLNMLILAIIAEKIFVQEFLVLGIALLGLLLTFIGIRWLLKTQLHNFQPRILEN